MGVESHRGALFNRGYKISDTTVGKILERNGIPPAPRRKPDSTWSDFVKTHEDVLSACDFFTAEVFTPAGLITFYVLFVIQIGSRKVHIAGVTTNPNGEWMKQVARNLTMDTWGVLRGQRYLIHDRDTKFCKAFRSIIEAVGIKLIKLPPKSPNLNAYAERWVRSVKSECTSNLIFFGEASLRKALLEFTEHYHEERNHQGKDNQLLCTAANDEAASSTNVSLIYCKERLGGLLKFYFRGAV